VCRGLRQTKMSSVVVWSVQSSSQAVTECWVDCTRLVASNTETLWEMQLCIDEWAMLEVHSLCCGWVSCYTSIDKLLYSSSHGLCRSFQASSQNFTIYDGVRCNGNFIRYSNHYVAPRHILINFIRVQRRCPVL